MTGTRASAWEAIDKPALKPLPTEPFDLSEWSRARVSIDYHVSFDANLYSVPYNLVHELVEIRSTPTTVEILHKGTRVASHLRNRGRGQAVTNDEHRPKSHRAHLEWTPSRMVHWAESIGPHTARLFERIMNDKPHPEMGYRGCLGIIRLAEKYWSVRSTSSVGCWVLTLVLFVVAWEHVYMVNNFWDRPRLGVADVSGRPHIYESPFDSLQDDFQDFFLVSPIDSELLALVLEDWDIWNRWSEANRSRHERNQAAYRHTAKN
jgi:hypothetical protein